MTGNKSLRSTAQCRRKKGKMKKYIGIILIIFLLGSILIGCDQASRASTNVSTSADNFQVTRRLSVINLRSDTPVFELIGVFSLSDESNRLVITCKTGEDEYKKHYISKGEWIFWFVEDISGANVSSYRYEVNILPEMFVPFEIVQEY